MPPDKRNGPEGPARLAAAKQTSTRIIADRQRQARERVQAQDRHRRICGELEQLASLVEYYCGPRRPRGWAA